MGAKTERDPKLEPKITDTYELPEGRKRIIRDYRKGGYVLFVDIAPNGTATRGRLGINRFIEFAMSARLIHEAE